MKKIIRPYTREELYDLYINQNVTVGTIAKKFNLTKSMIEKDLHKYNIKKPSYLCTNKYGVPKQIDTELLYYYYIEQNLSTDQCAEKFQVHERTIRRRLREFNINKPKSLQVSQG